MRNSWNLARVEAYPAHRDPKVSSPDPDSWIGSQTDGGYLFAVAFDQHGSFQRCIISLLAEYAGKFEIIEIFNPIEPARDPDIGADLDPVQGKIPEFGCLNFGPGDKPG